MGFLVGGLRGGEESSVDRLEASDTTCENRILGIKKLSTFKHALLGKWALVLHSRERSSLEVCSAYQIWGAIWGWTSKEV